MATKTLKKKKCYTVVEANARLPLLRSILRNVTELAQDLKILHERVILLQSDGVSDPEHDRDLARLNAELARGERTMAGYEKELAQLGAQLKDSFIGLVDFPCWMDDREVCLCWKLGEAEVAHWHETEAGFGGRRPLRSTSPARGNA